MLDFLRFLDAFDPDDDIGKSMPEASDKVRLFTEDLSFTQAGIFRPQELNVAERPVVDLPVAFEDVTVRRFATKRHEDTALPVELQSRLVRRLITQSEVGKAVGLPDPSYFGNLTPVQRAFARTKTEAFKTYTPGVCPWQGALIGLWHVAQRLLNYNVKDEAIKASNDAIILETGEALRGLSRSVGDSSSEIVRNAIARISAAADPKAAILAEQADAIAWAKAAGNDKELAAKEAESCEEEFLKNANMTRPELEQYGALRLPNGKLIHMRNVVKERMVHGESGELVRLGYSEDGDMGIIMSADEIREAETDRAEEHMDERAAENLAFRAGRGVPPIPILLDSDVHRPEKAVECEEIVRTFTFKVVERATGAETRFMIEGETKAMLAKEGWDRKFPAFMATGMVELIGNWSKDPVLGGPGPYRRTFSGYWATRPDGSEVRAFGDAPETRPMDMDAVDYLGIVRDPFPGSGFREDQMGCYAEQAGEVTVVLDPDWYTMNVEYNPDMREQVAKLQALKLEDIKTYAQRQQIHRDITAAMPGRNDAQRFLRGKLREHTDSLHNEAGWTLRMTQAIEPMLSVGYDSFHAIRGKVGADLKHFTNEERTIAWTFINALRQELRADAVLASTKSTDASFDSLIHKIKASDINSISMVRKEVEAGLLKMAGWKMYLLRDELLAKRSQFKKA